MALCSVPVPPAAFVYLGAQATALCLLTPHPDSGPGSLDHVALSLRNKPAGARALQFAETDLAFSTPWLGQERWVTRMLKRPG